MDSWRQDESCLSIFIYKLNKQGRIESLNLATDVREAVELKTVTKVSIDSENIYDEGDTRTITKETLVTIEAIIDQTSVTVISDYFDINNSGSPDEAIIVPPTGVGALPSGHLRGGNIRNTTNLDTNTLITFLDAFLSAQGIVIDLSNYPGQIRNIVPSVSNQPANSNFTSQVTYGLLTDSFNGPKPLSLKIESLPGGNSFRLIWKVKFTTSLQTGITHGYIDNSQSHLKTVPGVFDVSSELRLDIDKNGDLEIIVDGTIYATNTRLLYRAREYLNVIVYPLAGSVQTSNVVGFDPEDPDKTTIKQRYEDTFAQVNGFHKSVTFNVAKSGRSAKFSVKYTQIKSNSAHPLGIRDIQLEQTLESSLFGSDAFQGAGMVSWKNNFKGKIKIPHRFNSAYAWFVLWYLLAERTRKLKKFTGKISTKSVAKDLTDAINQVTTANKEKTRNKIKGLATRVKLKIDVFSREFSFDIDYLVMCPLNYVMSATCFFERLNNDYYKRYLLPKEADGSLSKAYRPEILSDQWIKWLKSVEPGYGFDPEAPGTSGRSPYRSNKEFMDNAGTEIYDGGHEINPFLPFQGRNTQQQVHSFVSTVIDPHEKDPDYSSTRWGIDDISDMYTLPTPGAIREVDLPNTMYFASTNNATAIGDKAISPASKNNDSSILEILDDKIDPRFSWIRYEENYRITETHPTIPVEGLSPVDASWHGEEKLYRQFVNNAPTDVFQNPDAFAPPAIPGTIPDPSAVTEVRFASGMHASPGETPESGPTPNVYNANHPEADNPVVRRTYAVKGSRYYITVRGKAIRAQYPISIPTVISIAGAPAIKVGNGRSMIAPMGTQGNTPIFMAAWEQTYTVDKSLLNEDILQRLESTGAEVLYS